MSKSSIQTASAGTSAAIQSAPATNGKPADAIDRSAESSRPPRKRRGPIRSVLQAAASLRLTVVLFALSIVLIFAGTLAQMDAGIGTVVKEYFRSLFVWIPLQLFVRFAQVFFGVPPLAHVNGYLPFPGGWLIGGLLLVNLLAAHAVRFRLTWKRAGVLILHTGILVLMAGELLTGLFAVEGHMTILAGGVSNIIKHYDHSEFAVIGPLETAPNDVTVVADTRLRKGGLIQSDQLPFDIQVDEYMTNSTIKDAPLRYTVPQHWRAGEVLVKNGIRRDAVFLVEDGDKSAELSITSAQGDVRDNINRWRRQLGLAPLTDEELKREAVTREIAGNPGVYVDLTGKKGDEQHRLLGAVLPRGRESYFIVLRGPAALVGREKPVFEAFLDSIHPDGRATAGSEIAVLAVPLREGAGVDSNVDYASAYVTLKKKGTDESAGTYLVSEWLSELTASDRPGQKVVVDGKTYEISLRFRRNYTPYTFQLLQAHHDRYPGTTIPNNFSSDIRILDPERNVDREVNIHMNVPLRYQRTSDEKWWQLLAHGQETFYQASMDNDATYTTLQVVRNPGWLAPYLACALVGLGMVVHFGITLLGFLQKRRLAGASRIVNAWPRGVLLGIALDGIAAVIVFALYMTGNYLSAAAGLLGVYGVALVLLHRICHPVGEPDDADGFARYFPWFVVATAGAIVIAAMMPPRDEAGKPRLQGLASLPVQSEGRVKPLDSLARSALMTLSDKQTFQDDKGVTRSAIDWLADVMAFSNPKLAKNPPRSPFSYRVFRIENDQLLTLLGLERREGLRYSVDEFRNKLKQLEEEGRKAREVSEKDRSVYQTHVLELGNKLQTYAEVVSLTTPMDVEPDKTPGIIPPDDPQPNAKWLTVPDAIDAYLDGRKDPATVALVTGLVAYGENRTKDFNDSVEKYRSLIAAKVPTAMTKVELETFFNNFAPFYVCMLLYVVVFLLAAFSWIGWSKPLNRAAFWLAALALLIHTFGLATRMYLQGRPPVTNLYSSAIFISWMCVLLGMALEVIFRIGIGNAMAGVLGFLGALIAHNLLTGDTLEMMRAVLDTNFWLATHVVCISTGYSATLLAGFLGAAYLFYTRSRWTTNSKTTKDLADMIYGIICFATLFSFVGTVLGGIWADQSWGRFWGWDPKENGALLIVIMNALTLHARWSGMVKQRGVAMLAILGNVVTGWSWFGTNQLGVGLHAYGFNNKLALWLTLFWASQALLLIGALIPAPWNRPGANAQARPA